ncbi:MAG: ArnT family glycosyltransferase [Burkholderiaceae bacterium]
MKHMPLFTSPTSLRMPTGHSPARLIASDTLELPRWALIALCLVYILPGLIGRDPWKSEDAAGFGVMWTMATGSGYGGIADWLLPNVAGAPVLDSGPLMYWVGAICIAIFGHVVNAALAARLATVIFFFVTVGGIWYATYLVGRRAAAQPAALAFGGQPEARDYGRVLADGALLILLATIGLLVRAHESSSDVAMLAMLALALYGMARSLDFRKAGAGWIAVAIVGLTLSRGPAPALAILALWLVLIAFNDDFKPARRATATVLVPITIAGLAIWPLATWIAVPDAATHINARLAEWARYFDGIDARAAGKYVRTLPWTTWIAWPLAFWGAWTWRKRLAAAHIALPGGFVLAMLGVLCSTSDTSDGQLLLVLPGLVMLAAFGLPTLRRGGANAFDWFSLMLYSIVAIFIWFAWFARVTGAPAGFARSIARLIPGAAPEFRPVVFAIALAATIAWLAIVRWRIVAHPKVLWRSVVLASGGLILAWTLTATLFLHAIDYGRTYRDVASTLSAALSAALSTPVSAAPSTPQKARAPADKRARAAGGSATGATRDARFASAPGGSCVATDGLGLAQRASFAWFADVRFSRVDYSGRNIDDCDYLLRQDLTRKPRAETLPQSRWTLLWEGRRAADRDERFRLYRKSGAGTTRGAGDAIDRNDGRDALTPAATLVVPVRSTGGPAAGSPAGPAAASPTDVPKKAP